MEAGVLVRVIKDFLTTTEGELCVAAGEILQVGLSRDGPILDHLRLQGNTAP